MFLNTRQSRRASSRIHAAIQDLTFCHFRTEGGEGSGGGTGSGSGTGTGTGTGAPADDKVTLTKAELQAQIDAALTAQEKKAQQKAVKEREDAERKKAEEQGEFKKLAADAQARADAAEAKAKAAERSLALTTFITENKPDLVKAAGLIAKLVDPAEEDTDKAIKAAVAEYEKSLPEKPKGSAGAPSVLARPGARGTTARSPRNGGRIFNGGTAAASNF